MGQNNGVIYWVKIIKMPNVTKSEIITKTIAKIMAFVSDILNLSSNNGLIFLYLPRFRYT